jgi:hypothetical protein
MHTKPPLTSPADILRQLKLLRYDPANGRGRARKIPIRYVAEMAGVHRATLYRAIHGQVSDKTLEALSPVLIMLQTDGT